MRSIKHIFKKKIEEKKAQKQAAGSRGFLEEEEDEDEVPNFTIDKELIIQAWVRYRPDSGANSPADGGASPISPKKKDISQIYGQLFLKKLLVGIKALKDGNESPAKGGADATFKDAAALLGEDDDIDKDLSNVPDEEMQLIEEFLDKFVFLTDAGSSKESIDLNLALKALPVKVELSVLYRIELLNFNLMHKSLIGFQNDEMDELYGYYDNRNKMRFNKLFNKAQNNEKMTEDVLELVKQAQSAMIRMDRLIR